MPWKLFEHYPPIFSFDWCSTVYRHKSYFGLLSSHCCSSKLAPRKGRCLVLRLVPLPDAKTERAVSLVQRSPSWRDRQRHCTSCDRRRRISCGFAPANLTPFMYQNIRVLKTSLKGPEIFVFLSFICLSHFSFISPPLFWSLYSAKRKSIEVRYDPPLRHLKCHKQVHQKNFLQLATAVWTMSNFICANTCHFLWLSASGYWNGI